MSYKSHVLNVVSETEEENYWAAWEGPSWLASCQVIAFVNRILLLLTIVRWLQAGLDRLSLNK